MLFITRVQKVKRVSLVPLGDQERMEWMVLMGKGEKGEHQDHLLKW